MVPMRPRNLLASLIMQVRTYPPLTSPVTVIRRPINSFASPSASAMKAMVTGLGRKFLAVVEGVRLKDSAEGGGNKKGRSVSRSQNKGTHLVHWACDPSLVQSVYVRNAGYRGWGVIVKGWYAFSNVFLVRQVAWLG